MGEPRLVDLSADVSGRRRRVLLIDDELAIRLAMRRFFLRQGWLVDEATNGESGFSLIVLDQRQSGGMPYDMIISDLRMPGLNGIDLYHRLAKECPAVLGRMVFSTGDIVSQEVAEFIAESSCLILEKPFELSTLRTMIERVVRANAPH